MSWDEALGLIDHPTTADPDRRVDGSSGTRSGGTLRRSHGRRTEPGPPSHLRNDLQGLRAVAVVAVVVNHMFGHPQGGFLGVDVFFVISGYLITSHLLREQERTGAVSMVAFYQRRIRRLVPAALTVTALTIGAAYLIFGEARFRSIVLDGFFATVFSANWRLIHTGTDYFGQFAAVSPLQHYWSLSVEEQFYVVWPLALLVIGLVVRGLRGGRRVRIGAGAAVVVMLTAASAVVAAHETVDEPVVAYFSTFARGWELGLGALLAFVVPWTTSHIGRLAATTLSWLGLAAVGTSFFFVDATAVPWPGATLACAGSMLVVAGHSARGNAFNPVLDNPLSRYVGDISYSVYLVHFPVIVFAAALATSSDRGVLYDIAVLAAALGLSILLYHLVEDPIRKSNWLLPRRDRGRDVERASIARVQLAGLVGATLCVSSVVSLVLAHNPATSNQQLASIADALDSASPTPTASGTATSPAVPTPALDTLQGDLATALRASSWPSLDPPLDAPRRRDPKIEACSGALAPASSCTWGDAAAPHTLYLVGDSTSVALVNAYAAAVATHSDWKVRAAGGDGCPWTASIPESLKHNWPDGCTARNQGTVAEILATRPDVLVVTNSRTDADYQQGVAAQLAQVKGAVAHTLIVSNGPPGLDPAQCFTSVSKPADCVSSPDSKYQANITNAAALASQYGGTAVDPTAWFCVNGYCPAFAAGMAIRYDGIHVTDAYATHLGPVVEETLHQLQIF